MSVSFLLLSSTEELIGDELLFAEVREESVHWFHLVISLVCIGFSPSG
jgi:hypothetical protein